MRVEEFVSQGHAEPVKGAFHGLAMVVCGLMFAYNTTAWLFRREPHLATNALVYGTAILYEGIQTQRHVAAHARAWRDETEPPDRTWQRLAGTLDLEPPGRRNRSIIPERTF
jgi:hypothetical protein